jgi:phage terminase small subunit
MEALGLALSPMQLAFAKEYTVDHNGTAAAMRAGYSIKFADRQAHVLMRHRGVRAMIDHLTLSKEAKLVSISPDYVIQKVTEIVTKADAKDGDKLRGLELLARHLGMFIERQEITGKDGGPLEIEQRKQIEENARDFNTFLKGLSKRADAEKGDTTH